MIVFKDHHDFNSKEHFIRSIYSYIDQIQYKIKPDYSTLVSLFIEVSEFETGISDVFEKEDDISTPVHWSHDITLASAQLVYDSWGNHEKSDHLLEVIKRGIAQFSSFTIIDRIPVCESEGYAFYGLYPEMYMEAAIEFARINPKKEVVCIGLRSIGTSLCALVDTVLNNNGCRAWSFTVRPKGHPFDRKINIPLSVKEKILRGGEKIIAVIDEGPGLSGSSIGGTLQKLIESGVTKNQIVLFPSWNPDGEGFISESAKKLWPQFRKVTKDFSDIWIVNKKLENMLGMRITHDFSAGNWREYLFKDESEYPSVNSHHERRKFLLIDENKRRFIAKWVGLGRYGERLVERAEKLNRYDFNPHIFDKKYGFVIFPFLSGHPVMVNDMCDQLLKFAVDYFTALKKQLPGVLSAPYEKMKEMIYLNVIEGIGEAHLKEINIIEKITKGMYESDIVSVDGRVLPHEWIFTGDRYFKVDHIEHHCDQFFPGCQNILWDLAAFCIEFDLDKEKQKEYLSYYLERNAEKCFFERFQFYTIAYLAFRLGYTKLAADSLKETADGKRFDNQTDKYKNKLISALS